MFYRSDIKPNRVTAVDHSDIINLIDREEAFNYLRNTSINRSFPWSEKLTPEAKTVLQQALVDGQAECNLNDPGTSLC